MKCARCSLEFGSGETHPNPEACIDALVRERERACDQCHAVPPARLCVPCAVKRQAAQAAVKGGLWFIQRLSDMAAGE